MKRSSKINNGLILDIHQSLEGDPAGGWKTMVRLSPEMRTSENYLRVMDIISNQSEYMNDGKGSGVRLTHGGSLPHQIETDLSAKDLLSSLSMGGLITQSEMIKAYGDLGLSPSRFTNRQTNHQPGFSLF